MKAANSTPAVAVFLFAMLLPGGAPAQSESATSLNCSSQNGQRSHCNAGTGNGVRLERQIGASPCRQGATWDYDSRGIWVDRGCHAVFEIGDGAFNGNQIAAGAIVSVRTNERINVRRDRDRVFTGFVNQDVVNANGGVAIPRGSAAEFVVRYASTRDFALDLESVTVNGQRYAVAASDDRTANGPRNDREKTSRIAAFIDRGLLGSIVGAIGTAPAGSGGRGSASLVAPAAVQGNSLIMPAESLLTFRLDQPLHIEVAGGR